MTTNEQLINDANALAKAIIDADDFDATSIIEPLSRLLPAVAFIRVCRTLDMCPVHYCDFVICDDDDEPECRDWRNS